MAVLIYMTAGSQDEAERIVEVLLEKKLIACANVFAPHMAVYEWNGEVKKELEVAVIMKSAAEKFSEIEACVQGMHSYDTPCLVQVPITAGHQPFLDWVDAT